MRERVLRRLRLLRQWRREGIPPGYLGRLPASLNDARRWNAPELGIFPIGSKSDFVTVHMEWGGDVREIHALLKELRSMYQPVRKRKSSRSEAVEARQESERRGILLEQLAAQWHEAREASLNALREVSAGAASYADLKEQYEIVLRTLANREQEIIFLRRQLANLKR